jgi:hypothetical protein
VHDPAVSHPALAKKKPSFLKKRSKKTFVLLSRFFPAAHGKDAKFFLVHFSKKELLAFLVGIFRACRSAALGR